MEVEMRDGDASELRKLLLFQTMGEECFDTLLKGAYFQTFPREVQLITEGDGADFLFIVVEGSVELFANANGREATMTVVKPSGTFILAAVLKDAVYLMSGRTCEKSRILMVPAENVRAAFRKDENFARAIVVELASCYRGVVRDHKDQKLRTGVERLANRLIKYHRTQGGSGRLTLPYDKRMLASLLGMTPENLSRAFATLRPYGVEVDGARVVLNDLKSLETLAKPNSLIDQSGT
jgi:CRP/FNR family transcriptional regulator, transcriptional activator FtrB